MYSKFRLINFSSYWKAPNAKGEWVIDYEIETYLVHILGEIINIHYHN